MSEDGWELDPLFDEAVRFVVAQRKVSISGVQRQFRIGYNRAARIVEQMEGAGVVSEQGYDGNREVLTELSMVDNSKIEALKSDLLKKHRDELKDKVALMNSVPEQQRISAITNRKIVIWLEDTGCISPSGFPTIRLRSFSPFPYLATHQKNMIKSDDVEYSDIIDGYKFIATMQMRTPANVLSQHGRIEKQPVHRLPRIVRQEWQGIWMPNPKSFRDMGLDIDEMPMGTMASDIGQVPADGGDYLRFLLFINHVNTLEVDITKKKELIRNAYFMVGQDGEQLSKFMDKYGDSLEQMVSRLVR